MRDFGTLLRARAVRLLRRSPRWVGVGVDAVVSCAESVRTVVLSALSVARPAAALPPSIPALDSATRVLIAPANFAGQGDAWARAISNYVAGASAANLAFVHASGYQFQADSRVPVALSRYERSWQQRESEWIANEFTHVLVEAMTPLFGSLFRSNLDAERAFFERNGVSVAYICHGSDIRSPRRHARTSPLSPFLDDGVHVDRAQRRVDRHVRLLQSSGAKVFVSTPDLLDDYPDGIWAPVVVKMPDVRVSRSRSEIPTVLHMPSSLAVKGSHMIRDAVNRVARSGLIRYVEVTQRQPDEIKALVLESDIVLDQFRLGSYGAAACEAMAAGKVVVGHVSESVRSTVRRITGMELPIVQATPDTLERSLKDLSRDAELRKRLGEESQRFVQEIHSGRWTARVFDEHWLKSRHLA